MKTQVIKLGVALAALSFLVGAAGQASADVVVSANVVVNGNGLYDAAGIPIWGYGTRGRAIYAYSPEGLPVYAFNRVYSGCIVPDWGFHPRYEGPRWPRGIHQRSRDYRPPRRGMKAPAPPPRPDRRAPGGRGHRPGPGERGGPGGPRR